MGATLATLRKYIRAEVGDQEATEKMASETLTNDGGNGVAYFEDASFDFVAEGVVEGDVIQNVTDGGSLSTIKMISAASNKRLTPGPIEGGTTNDFATADVIRIYDRHAQRGLGNTRWTDVEVEDALSQAQKLVAIRFGGIERFNVHGDIKVMTKINFTVPSGTFTVGETVTGDGNSHTAVVEYVGDDFIIVSTMRTTLVVDGMDGTFQVNELVTGATNGYTGRFISTSGATNMVLEDVSGTFDDDETMTGATSEAEADLDDGDGYSSGLFLAGETLTGGTSSATANVKATYAANNICLGQDMPTDLKHLLVARWWDGSNWYPLVRDNIREFTSRPGTSGDPLRISVFGVDQLVSDSAPNKKIWLWPSNSAKRYNELHLFYMAWDRSLSADTDTTDFDNKVERLIVLEAGKMLAGQVNEDELWQRLITEITLVNLDITGATNDETNAVAQVINWDYGWVDDEGAFIS
jgi:hypothetical protein